MHRYGLVALVLLLIPIFSLACNGTKDPAQPTDPAKPQKLALPKVLVPTFLASSLVRPCRPTDPAMTTTDAGAFRCINPEPFSTIELTVTETGLDVNVIARGEYAMTESKTHLKIEQGSCIQWVVKGGTPEFPAKIKAIDFIDPGQIQPGKASNSRAICDYCSGTEQCVMYVSLPKGIYRYNAIVNHKGGEKKADPEVEVQCSGCTGTVSK